MPTIRQANIERFRLLLTTEMDPVKRGTIERLLAEEEAKQVPGEGLSYGRTTENNPKGRPRF